MSVIGILGTHLQNSQPYQVIPLTMNTKTNVAWAKIKTLAIVFCLFFVPLWVFLFVLLPRLVLFKSKQMIIGLEDTLQAQMTATSLLTSLTMYAYPDQKSFIGKQLQIHPPLA